jgi:hypothetical protein
MLSIALPLYHSIPFLAMACQAEMSTIIMTQPGVEDSF